MQPECNCYSDHACLQFRVCLIGESLSLGAGQACVEDTHTESCGQQTFMSGLPAQLLWFSMQRAEFYVYVLTSPLFGMPAHIMLGIARKCLEFVSSGQITYASSPPHPQVLRHDLYYKCGIMVWFSRIEISPLSLFQTCSRNCIQCLGKKKIKKQEILSMHEVLETFLLMLHLLLLIMV